MRNDIRGILLCVAALVLAGAGCGASSVTSFHPPVSFNSLFDASKPYALTVGAGARLKIRPSVFGISGTLQDLLGEGNAKDVTVTALDGTHLALVWRDHSTTDTAALSTVSSTSWASAHMSLPPAFWKKGDLVLAEDSLLWLSPASYAELTGFENATEWHPSFLESDTLSSKAVKAAGAVQSVAARLAPLLGLSATGTSPFHMTKTADIGLYPLRINGTLERVEAIRASGPFADLIILKNPATPLVLNITLRPAALAALKALGPFAANASEFGYEVTEVDTN